RAGRRQQSGRRLYPRSHGAEQRDHRRGAASPRRGVGLAHDPEKWKSVFGKDHAPTKAHDPEKWTPVFGKDHTPTKRAAIAYVEPRPQSRWNGLSLRPCRRRAPAAAA